MIEAIDRDLRPASCFRENGSTLNHGLRIQGETLRRPIAGNSGRAHCSVDVGFERRGVIADRFLAGVANRGLSFENFLNRRPGKARVVRQIADEQHLAKVDIGEDTVTLESSVASFDDEKRRVAIEHERFDGGMSLFHDRDDFERRTVAAPHPDDFRGNPVNQTPLMKIRIFRYYDEFVLDRVRPDLLIDCRP